jgi:hypothetical protein
LPRERLLRRLTWGYLVFQAALMVAVRVGDGSEAFLEGAAARGWSVVLWLQAVPAALAMARSGPLDDGLLALGEARGIPAATLLPRVHRAPWSRLLRALAPAAAALALWPLLLSLGAAPGAFALRLALLCLLLAIASLASLCLMGLALLLARLLPSGPAPRAFLLLLLGPWLLASLAGLPAEASLPGIYRALVGFVLGLAPS